MGRLDKEPQPSQPRHFALERRLERRPLVVHSFIAAKSLGGPDFMLGLRNTEVRSMPGTHPQGVPACRWGQIMMQISHKCKYQIPTR